MNYEIKIAIYDILMQDDVRLSICENLDFLLYYIPEIKDMIGFAHNHPHHHLDVWEHTLLALSVSPKDFYVRIALLFHDIGKPHCYTEGEIRHFKNHNIESELIARSVFNRLKYDEEFINHVCYLIYYHDIPITKEDIIIDYEKSYERFLVQKCDALAHHPEKLEKRKKYLISTMKKFKEIR